MTTDDLPAALHAQLDALARDILRHRRDECDLILSWACQGKLRKPVLHIRRTEPEQRAEAVRS